MARRYVTPAIGLSAFSCPHCGTLTSQTWYPFYSSASKNAHIVWRPETVEQIHKDGLGSKMVPDAELAVLRRLAQGELILENMDWESQNKKVDNIAVSCCGECGAVAIWVYDRMIWPIGNEAPEANPDLPADIMVDYREAGAILPASPRGAAALLRLCLQKLCAHILGPESGSTIDKDIGKLVSKGLDFRIQRALDIVRVVGNEAVHPGTMDLKDDRGTAEEMFRLINLVADTMISQPRRIDEMYAALPAQKVEAIEERNRRVLPTPSSEVTDN